MFLFQIKKLKELQEQHAFALAAAKQAGHQFSDDSERLAALALFELNLQMTNAIRAYAEAVGDDDASLAAGIAVLAGGAGALAGFTSTTDPEGGENTMEFAKKYLQLQFEKHNGK